MKQDPNKSKLFIGAVLMLGAFLCVLIVFYFLVNAHRERLAEIETLEEKFLALDTEKNSLQRKVVELQDEIGRSIYLNKLIDESQNQYGNAEKDRREGFLWIDRETSTLIVTLGVLHGVSTGTKLTLYDQNDQPSGHVIVDTAMDVISYVHPMGRSITDLEQTYYRATIE